ncbi:MAG: hypothetical protein HGA54_00630 [Actinobacteria bacterium]|nr:hypothetical protein [Actinomycetota bacterium]
MLRRIKRFLRTNPVTRPLYVKLHNAYYSRPDKRYESRKQVLASSSSIFTQRIYAALEGKDIEYFYTYGSLLGLVREGHFLGHDLDMDLGILNTRPTIIAELDAALRTQGFSRAHYFTRDDRITECTYELEDFDIDFFLYDEVPGGLTTSCYFRDIEYEYDSPEEFTYAELPISMISGFTYVELEGVSLRIPKNAEQILKESYGEDWRVPKLDWHMGDDANWTPKPGRGYIHND